MWRYVLIFLLLMPAAVHPAQQADLEEQARQIAAVLRCPVCQNLSAADSPSELAQQMRAIILQQLKEGKSPDQIKAYFVSKYGEWVLLAPTAKGFGLLIWVLPYVAVAAGIALVLFVVRRWARKKDRLQPSPIDPSLIERVKRESAMERPPPMDPEAEGPRFPLLQEQARIYADLRELEFDYQAGKLSEDDYQDLRHALETEAVLVLKRLEVSPPSRPGPAPKPPGGRPAAAGKKAVEMQKASRPAWRLAAGGIFLLLFGITLGVLLTKSVRPRGSEQDTITGDFLTGTGSGGIGPPALSKEIPVLLAQGRAAYERQQWPQAIEAFKKTLEMDPNQPEAHTYMGLILAQSGHADGALMAFDRALSSNPNLTLALWGKGMVLYQAKQDLPAARQTLEKLLGLLPPGNDRNVIQKTIAEIAQLSSGQKEQGKIARAEPSRAQIRGTVSIDARLKTQLDNNAVLFIIARSASSPGGPPLAVRKIERPLFPVSYSLGPEHVMVPGMAFAGKVNVSVRLDRDGNPATREPGDLAGEYQKNPVEIGSQKIDIVIDRAL